MQLQGLLLSLAFLTIILIGIYYYPNLFKKILISVFNIYFCDGECAITIHEFEKLFDEIDS